MCWTVPGLTIRARIVARSRAYGALVNNPPTPLGIPILAREVISLLLHGGDCHNVGARPLVSLVAMASGSLKQLCGAAGARGTRGRHPATRTKTFFCPIHRLVPRHHQPPPLSPTPPPPLPLNPTPL